MDAYEQKILILGDLVYRFKIGKENGKTRYGLEYNELSNFAAKKGIDRMAFMTTIQDLLGTGCITVSDDWVEITSTGRERLNEFEKNANQQAYQNAREKANECRNTAQTDKNMKKQFRYEVVVAIIGAVVGSLCTLTVEHFLEIVDFIKSVFH